MNTAFLIAAIVSTAITVGLLFRTRLKNEELDNVATRRKPYIARNRTLLIVAWAITAALWAAWRFGNF